MKTFIELKNMAFHAFHGVLPEEKEKGNNFTVTVKFSANLSAALFSDNLNDTVNYAELYDLVKSEMEIPSELIEHAAGRIYNRIKANFSQIEWLEVRLSKLKPPVNGTVEASEVTISD